MIDWNQIDLLLLDMDGTLLDLHFDNHFWLQHVPERYAQVRGIALQDAKDELYARYKRIEGTLDWYCVDHWSRELELDIVLLKEEVDHLIAVHPHVIDFLQAVRAAGKRCVLVTNAHQKSLALKMRHTQLDGHLDNIISAHELGLPKEHAGFWERLQQREPFESSRTLFVDDSPSVLRSAQAYGIRWLLRILKPDTHGAPRAAEGFPAVEGFAQLLPLPRQGASD
jgi:putative hydrolase of the HAD superfamily